MAAPRRAATAVLCALAAATAVVVSSRLLQAVAPPGMFGYLLALNFATAPLGFALVASCSQGLPAPIAETFNVGGALALTSTVSGSLGVMHKIFTDGKLFSSFQVCFGEVCFVPVTEQPRVHYREVAVAVLGLAMSTGVVCALIHSAFQDLTATLSEMAQWRRKLWASSPWGPKPKLLVCDDLEAFAPGECAICLERLVDQPKAAYGKDTQWLLELPCKHTFHEACVLRWIDREVNCPLCRQPAADVSLCTRLCVGCPPAAKPALVGNGAYACLDEEDKFPVPASSVCAALGGA